MYFQTRAHAHLKITFHMICNPVYIFQISQIQNGRMRRMAERVRWKRPG